MTLLAIEVHVSSDAADSKFGLTLYQRPKFVHLHILTLAFDSRQCKQCQRLTCRLIHDKPKLLSYYPYGHRVLIVEHKLTDQTPHQGLQ